MKDLIDPVELAKWLREKESIVSGIFPPQPISIRNFAAAARIVEDYAAASEAGWVLRREAENRYTVQEVIDALIRAGFTRVQMAEAKAAMIAASTNERSSNEV